MTDGPSRYDWLLAAIATPLVLAAVLGTVLPVTLPAAMGVGSLPAGCGVGYALFYSPPGS